MNGSELIAAERQRQVEAEGWTSEHDLRHGDGELLYAADQYLNHALLLVLGDPTSDRASMQWPWGNSWWKPSPDPIRNLVKAGALIAAEIDRLAAVAAPSEPQP